MKFFKENLVFCIVLIVLLLAFVGGAYMDYTAFETSKSDVSKEGRAKSALRSALALKPAPTEENLEAAKANVAALKESLRQQIETTKGTKTDLINDKVPANGTQLLFELRGYRDELLREAARAIPINVNEKSVSEGNIPNPGVKIPAGFAFGFSRYLGGADRKETPPADGELKQVYLQKQILSYLLDKLLDTRPIEIKAVQRETPESVSVTAAAPTQRPAARRQASNQSESQLPSDEFKVGKETAAVKDVVETMGFRLVFTGYTENLRQFMKALEVFELPLVVRSVEVKPLELSVRVGNTSANRGAASSLDAIFGSSTTPAKGGDAVQMKKAQEPVVAENISEYTVVIEYITVTLKSN